MSLDTGDLLIISVSDTRCSPLVVPYLASDVTNRSLPGPTDRHFLASPRIAIILPILLRKKPHGVASHEDVEGSFHPTGSFVHPLSRPQKPRERLNRALAKLLVQLSQDIPPSPQFFPPLLGWPSQHVVVGKVRLDAIQSPRNSMRDIGNVVGNHVRDGLVDKVQGGPEICVPRFVSLAPVSLQRLEEARLGIDFCQVHPVRITEG